MRYERVKVTRDQNMVHNKDVAPWEIAILEFTFGEGNVARTEQFVQNDLPYPDAATEFQRLGSAYGADPQSGVPYVASVYGQASAGMNHLRRAIAEAKAEDEALKPKPASKRKASRRIRAEVLADPLMA